MPKFLKPRQLVNLLESIHALETEHAEDKRTASVMWVHDWVLFLATTGLRPGEAQALLWENVDLDDEYLYVRNTTHHTTKTENEGVVPLAPQAIDVLDRLEQEQRTEGVFSPTSRVFLGQRGGPVDVSRAAEVIRLARQRAELPSWTVQRILRASCASYLKAQGLSDGFIAKVLRHEDPRTLKHYARAMNDDVKREVQRAYAGWSVQPSQATPRSFARSLRAHLGTLAGLGEEIENTLHTLGADALPEAAQVLGSLAQVRDDIRGLGAVLAGGGQQEKAPATLQRSVSKPVLSGQKGGAHAGVFYPSGSSSTTQKRPARNARGVSNGAEHGTRTRDLNLGKVALYQLS